jgi:hypothetical protein
MFNATQFKVECFILHMHRKLRNNVFEIRAPTLLICERFKALLSKRSGVAVCIFLRYCAYCVIMNDEEEAGKSFK